MRLGSRITLLWALWLAAPAVHAATVVPLTFDELVAQSSAIAHAEVVSTESRWTADRSTIVTDVRVRTLESFKGDGGDIVFTQLGGTVGKLKVSLEGVTPFVVGDEVVLFVKPTPVGLQLTGATQGRFDVITDARSGTKQIRGIDAGPDAHGTGKAHAAASRLQSLDSFREELRQHIAAPATPNQGGR